MSNIKVTIVGGASITWLPIFIKDLCACKEIQGGELVLHDLNMDALVPMKAFCEKVMEEKGAKFNIILEGDLEKSITDATIVLCNVLIGGHKTWEKEINKILEYGIAHPKGMSVGPGGMIMGIKQIPYIVELAQLMEKVCPNAWLLNYSNPMQCITLAAQKYSKTKTIGLCHGVTHSILKYCEWLGIDRKEVSVRCGGVNHFELVMEFVKDGKDLLPELIAKMDTLEIDGSEFGDLITKEMYKIFGALPTNHDIHSIEFYPHFLKRNTKLENYRLKQNNVAVRMSDGKKRWEKAYAYTKGEIPLDDIIKEHETEMLDSIIHTIVTNEPMVLDANITNNGCIRNLPDDVCVGVPVVLGRDGYKGVNVGEIPLGLDAMQYLHATIQKFIVDAAMTGNKQSIVKALTLDPMCYDLSYSERNNLIDDLLEIAKDYLPAFNK